MSSKKSPKDESLFDKMKEKISELKNNIKEKEYLLLTDSLLDNYNEDELKKHVVWENFKKDEENFEHLNEIGYRYLPNPSHSMI